MTYKNSWGLVKKPYQILRIVATESESKLIIHWTLERGVLNYLGQCSDFETGDNYPGRLKVLDCYVKFLAS